MDRFTIYLNRENLDGTNLGYRPSALTKDIFVTNLMLKINGSWNALPK